jgi:regulatory protein
VGASDRPRGTAKDRALRLLGARARSREELRRRLTQAGFEGEAIDQALSDLEAAGLIDDERFARELARYELGRRSVGRRAAVASLRRKGVGPDLAERVVEDLAPDDEEGRAVEVARHRLTRLSGLAEDVAYRRLVGFLQRRGYDARVAHAACKRALAEHQGVVA